MRAREKSNTPAGRAARTKAMAPPNGTAEFSLEAYMADDCTRVFNYNGRKLVSILGREKFPGDRVFKLPPKAIEFASRQCITAALLPCRIGYFPHARGQKVSRPDGDWAFTLLFCLDGAGTLELSDQRHQLTRGMLALLRPFEFHAYSADKRQPWSYYWIHFNGTMAQQYYDTLTLSGKRTCVAIEPDVKFVQAFEHILAIYREGHAHKLLVQAAAVMHQLLGDLYGLICSRENPQDTALARIERTIEVVRENPGVHVSIHELAATANMSPAHYAHQFRRHTGESPRAYFNKLRIEKACDFLSTTDAKIESIAHLVGCEDAFYFCRLFKRIKGVTPSDFRRAHVGRGAKAGIPLSP